LCLENAWSVWNNKKAEEFCEYSLGPVGASNSLGSFKSNKSCLISNFTTEI